MTVARMVVVTLVLVSVSGRQFGGETDLVQTLNVLCFVNFAMSFQPRMMKRIANGHPLNSHEDYQTQHFISLRKIWGCVSDQRVHDLEGCFEISFCGGTLIHPEFVLTACHCASFRDFYLREKTQIYHPDSIYDVDDPEEEGIYDEGGVNVHVVVPQKIHAIYSNTALLAGSIDYFGSEQKRHALKVFPHPQCAIVGKNSYLTHDAAIIQVCEPFEIKGNVKLAPMMPLNEQTAHWESVVKRSAVCLYVGFGDTDDKSTYFDVPPNWSKPTQFLRYTWRTSACASLCNFHSKLKWDQIRNTCFLCSDHIPPNLGSPLGGDSGGPIVCDGYFTGHITAAIYKPILNSTRARGYPVHCIKDALTPDRLAYYKSVPIGERKLHPLWPVPKFNLP